MAWNGDQFEFSGETCFAFRAFSRDFSVNRHDDHYSKDHRTRPEIKAVCHVSIVPILMGLQCQVQYMSGRRLQRNIFL